MNLKNNKKLIDIISYSGIIVGILIVLASSDTAVFPDGIALFIFGMLYTGAGVFCHLNCRGSP